MKKESQMKDAYLAAGSFWEAQLSLDAVHGVLATYVGYMGGFMPYPTHSEVLSGKTGHAQTVRVLYDEDIISYGDLVDCFFEIHNPTTLNRQGPDVGTAFRSILFYQDALEKKIAQKAKALFNIYNRYHLPAVTQIRPVELFYAAEDMHQHFLEKRWPLFN